MASRGYEAYDRGDYRAAIAYFEDALAADPDNAFAIQGLAASRDGALYFGDRRPVDRDAETEEAIYRASLLGHDAYERGDLGEAEARFRAVLEIAPGNRYALRGMEAVRRRTARRDTVTTIPNAVEAPDAPATTAPDGGADVPADPGN